MKFKIKTYLWSGIVMGLISLGMLLSTTAQVKVPAYDSGAPSPRIIPVICLIIMLVSSIALIIQSLVFKKEKIVEFDWKQEKPIILLILMLCIYVALIMFIGYIAASVITFIALLAYCKEKSPWTYIFAIVMAVVIYFMFSKLFNISLPAGTLLGRF